MSIYHVTPDSIRKALAVPASSHPHPEHLYCTVCGGSYHAPLSVVLHCEHCKGTGLEPRKRSPVAVPQHIQAPMILIPERDVFDDRHYCYECSHLRYRRCTQLAFKPTDDLPRRCSSFNPA